MLSNNVDPSSPWESGSKRKRRPAGTPDPDAEVVSLSPKTLLESDRYVCEICKQGFQREQNLQMHRRRHKVPWKLVKRETPLARKRVFVCPEPTCLHHQPGHALGDLVGIKKHFRRKHSNHKHWLCNRCSKAYAVHSDYKAHLKTCGTRGHSCDCGRVFSRVESFIEHQDACSMSRLRSECHPVCLSRTASSPSPSSDTNLSVVARRPFTNPPNLELQLLTAAGKLEDHSKTQLQLSIGSSEVCEKAENNANKLLSQNGVVFNSSSSPRGSSSTAGGKSAAREQAEEQLRTAMTEKAYAEDARQQARRQIELAEQELANAKRIRQQAQAELEKAQALRQQAAEQTNAAVQQFTCQSCQHKFQFHEAAAAAAAATSSTLPETSSASLSYMSAALREWGIERTPKQNP
ncbi:zinc finger protein SHOOT GRAVITROPISM 5-like [Andrographis paniculata]|uniref:zinc finger protein SHOOT GRAVITROPISM 5-like n=1 Tax=Andrographis paniculata TaxID=175694 RepID=UPI0021E7F372|nr:zinc finger protein SHOOT GRAVITROPISM 5-like [Andrographis paniculata]